MKQTPKFSRLITNPLLGAMAMLLAANIACGAARPQAAPVAPPSGTVPVNQEAADRLKQNFNQALQEAGGQRESQLRITNEEISSLVAAELTQTGQIPVSDPQIWFTSGRIYMTSKVQVAGPVKLDSIIVATAVVDNGKMVLKVEEAKMGPFDFPDGLIETTTQTVNETLTSILIGADLEITRLEILEGEMFVIGTRKI